MINFYWAFLITGVVLTALSFLLDGIFDSIDFDFRVGDIHLPIKSFNVVCFIAMFGGAGVVITYILPFPFISQYIAFIPALLIAYFTARKLYVLLRERLRKYETKAVTSSDIIGVEATVIETIPQNGGLGKIIFVVNGNTISGVAKDRDPDGNGFARHSKVFIANANDTMYEVVDTLSKIPKSNMESTSIVDLR